MSKFVGLVGAMTAVGAVAYLMAPLPQSETGATANAASNGPPAVKVAAAPKSIPSAEPLLRPVSTRSAPRGDPTEVLVQQIQSELHRLGCYVGAIDGQWSAATQRAMQTLGERVSVLRPVDTPDYIMLALARDQASNVCAPTQRAAAVGSRDKWAAIAKPDIPKPQSARAGRGEVRPTNGAARIAATEPDRPSTSEPKVWRAIPEASAKRAPVRETAPGVDAARLKAARDELARIETRKLAAAATDQPASERQPPAQSDDARMSLGVAPVDPLQAYVDPRNPHAPAILRGPPQPLPQFASQDSNRPPIGEVAPEPAPATGPRPSAKPELSASDAKKRAKREWMRSVFTNMRFNGP